MGDDLLDVTAIIERNVVDRSPSVLKSV